MKNIVIEVHVLCIIMSPSKLVRFSPVGCVPDSLWVRVTIFVHKGGARESLDAVEAVSATVVHFVEIQ